jgi:hypothetical protein
VDWETGKLNYEEEWVGKGPIIYSDGMLILYEERTGQVGLMEPNPGEFRLISSFKHEEGSGPHWAHPSISDGVLYIRHGKALTAYRIGN